MAVADGGAGGVPAEEDVEEFFGDLVVAPVAVGVVDAAVEVFVEDGAAGAVEGAVDGVELVEDVDVTTIG